LTVPQILVTIQEHDFGYAFRLAVSIGGDSNTIAAITDSIAEAFYNVPEWMKEAAMERFTSEMEIFRRKFYNLLNDETVQRISN
jgi:ADP-ribosylglycohydrolase